MYNEKVRAIKTSFACNFMYTINICLRIFIIRDTESLFVSFVKVYTSIVSIDANIHKS